MKSHDWFGCVGLSLGLKVWGRLLKPLSKSDEAKVEKIIRMHQEMWPNVSKTMLQKHCGNSLLQACLHDDMPNFELFAHAIAQMAGKNFVMVTAKQFEEGNQITVSANKRADAYTRWQPARGLLFRLRLDQRFRGDFIEAKAA